MPALLASIRECPDCGIFVEMPTEHSSVDVCCIKCGKTLRHIRHHSMLWTLTCVVAGLLFYWISACEPLLQVSLYSRFRWDEIGSGLQVLGEQGFLLLAILIFLVVILMPLIKLLGLLIVFGGLHLERPPRWIVTIFRELKHLNPWTMAEIYLLGVLVAYTRLQAMTHVSIETAVYALIGLTLSLTAIDVVLDQEAVWQEILNRGLINPIKGHAEGFLFGCSTCCQANPAASIICLRCGSNLDHRKPYSLQRTWALVLAAILLYIPANFFPVMNISKLGNTQSYTIMRGVIEFIHAGLWPLALLVFVASIVIPALKLIFLIFMLIQTHRESSAYLLGRTRLYRFIEFIGRWSMIDVFMLSILVGLMRFGKLASITAGNGATYFALVVIFSMLAVLSFDPRLMWDVGKKSKKSKVLARL